jgi:hypothetical protein
MMSHHHGGGVRFIRAYAPVANETRRFFFLITTVSFLGALDG